MNGFLQTLRNLGPMRLAAIGIVVIALLGFFSFLTSRMTHAPMSLLYSELEQQDASAIAARLDQMKIPFEVTPDGRSVKVPADMVGRARMAAAAEGLPKGGSIGYEIFDQKESFGTTTFVQNVNHLRALEGELARTISTLTPISSARVHLVLPQRELFSRNQTAASASIFLKMRSAATLTKEQVSAIQNLIAAAVPQLQTNQISIIDDRGNLLARPMEGDNTLAMGASQDDIRLNFERAQARKIEDLLAQSIGFGRVRAQVSAEMDFDRITTQSEIYDPESQVVRSQQNTSEDTTSSNNASGSASITSNIPAGLAPEAGGGSGNTSNRTEQTINYEINKTIRSQVRESGQVRRLSVAVVVDGSYAPDENDKEKMAYTPRTEEEMKQIEALVRSAISFDASRGDTLEVTNMRFMQPEETVESGLPQLDMMFGFPKEDLFRLIEIVVLAIVGVLVLLLVVRPLLRRAMESAGSFSGGGDQQAAIAAGGSPAQLSGPMGGGDDEESALDSMIDIGRVDGRVKASSIRKVGELVDKHPEESVGILRNWMYQENR
ncbi:MAG: flagellar M-ring protein FliF [Alphaproteobacteria bacterium]|nr:flagellar M-ring protein FliF [Alphaproteobacteria bacterium]